MTNQIIMNLSLLLLTASTSFVFAASILGGLPKYNNLHGTTTTTISTVHGRHHPHLSFISHSKFQPLLLLRNTPHSTKYPSKASNTHKNYNLQNTHLPSKTISTNHCSHPPLQMSLIPTPLNELQTILAIRTPTGDQYVTYLGRTPRERFDSLFEGAAIAFLGSMFSYFVSFVIGQFLATILGTIFVFWPILAPEFKAYQRNWELCGGRDLIDVWMDGEDDDGVWGGWGGLPQDKRGLYGAYYVSRVEDVCVVDDVLAVEGEEYDLEEFEGYSMEKDELESVVGSPWKLRLRLADEEGRGMQIHCRMSEDYLDIRKGMNVVGVLLSTSREFVKLAAMTDFCVLDAVGGPVWVGDYPYLDKDKFLRTLGENGIADSLVDIYDDNDYYEEDEIYDDDDDFIDDDNDSDDNNMEEEDTGMLQK